MKISKNFKTLHKKTDVFLVIVVWIGLLFIFFDIFHFHSFTEFTFEYTHDKNKFYAALILIALLLRGVINRKFRARWLNRFEDINTKIFRLYFFSALVICEIGLVIMHFQTDPKSPWSLDREAGWGTLFSALQLYFISIIILSVILRLKELHPRSQNYLTWYFLSGLFLYLALDEGFSIHEMFSPP